MQDPMRYSADRDPWHIDCEISDEGLTRPDERIEPWL